MPTIWFPSLQFYTLWPFFPYPTPSHALYMPYASKRLAGCPHPTFSFCFVATHTCSPCPYTYTTIHHMRCLYFFCVSPTAPTTYPACTLLIPLPCFNNTPCLLPVMYIPFYRPCLYGICSFSIWLCNIYGCAMARHVAAGGRGGWEDSGSEWDRKEGTGSGWGGAGTGRQGQDGQTSCATFLLSQLYMLCAFLYSLSQHPMVLCVNMVQLFLPMVLFLCPACNRLLTSVPSLWPSSSTIVELCLATSLPLPNLLLRCLRY